MKAHKINVKTNFQNKNYLKNVSLEEEWRVWLREWQKMTQGLKNATEVVIPPEIFKC